MRISAPLTFSRLHLAPKLGEFLDVKVRAYCELLMDDRIVYGVAVNIDAELRFGELTDSALHAQTIHGEPAGCGQSGIPGATRDPFLPWFRPIPTGRSVDPDHERVSTLKAGDLQAFESAD